MKNSVHQLATLVALVLALRGAAAVCGGRVGETWPPSGAPYCSMKGASADYEAHKAHVLDELANVTPTMEGCSYSTTFPPVGSTGAHDFVDGSAACASGAGVSECVSCLIGAKLSLAENCASDLYGSVNLPLCRMGYVPVAI